MSNSVTRRQIFGTIIVAALGYFVDVYDIIIFSVVRISSLKSLGFVGEDLVDKGLLLLNVQMIGMLVGGVIWGVSADKKGRISVLLGSIFLYSVANIANGFVNSFWSYAFWRFVAGFGLAGELGAGVTIVSELLPKETRGYGTTIVATVGVAGAVVASIVGDLFDWRVTYWIGGCLGIGLLVLRISVHESAMFKQTAEMTEIPRGDLRQLFNSRERFFRYLHCIMIGLPIWYTVGILVTLAPEFGRAFGIAEAISAGEAVLFAYVGFIISDCLAGLLSQWLKSRRKALLVFLLLTALCFAAYLYLPHPTAKNLYLTCLALGLGVGYWAVFIASAAEQFGTNLRATVATTVPNFIRGSVVPLTSAFLFLKAYFGIINAAGIVGGLCVAAALFSLSRLKETFGTDLDFVEG